MIERQTYKVGVNRQRRRIWIDGPRLTRAGFTPGVHYWSPVSLGRMTLTLSEVEGHTARRVSGRPDGKPIVDISGRDVHAAFPTCAAVDVEFRPGVISIVPSTRNA
jgi:DNA (cytosine-5)-methyltransferase 1